MAHLRLSKLGHDVGTLEGTRSWGAARNRTEGRLCETLRTVLVTSRGEFQVRMSDLLGVLVLLRCGLV